MNNFNYDKFIKKYNDEHYCCPKCGSRNFSCTLAGYIVDTDHPEEYKDKNRVECHNCNWEGIYHDLAPKPGITEFKDLVKKVAGIYYSEELVDELLDIARKIYSK